MSHWKAWEPVYCFPGHDVHWDEPIDVGGRAYADTVKCNYCARHAWRQTDMLFVWAAGETGAWWFPPASIVQRVAHRGKKLSRKKAWDLKKKIGFLFLKQLALISGKINPFLMHGKRQKALFGIQRVHSRKAGSQTLTRSDRSSINII